MKWLTKSILLSLIFVLISCSSNATSNGSSEPYGLEPIQSMEPNLTREREGTTATPSATIMPSNVRCNSYELLGKQQLCQFLYSISIDQLPCPGEICPYETTFDDVVALLGNAILIPENHEDAISLQTEVNISMHKRAFGIGRVEFDLENGLITSIIINQPTLGEMFTIRSFLHIHGPPTKIFIEVYSGAEQSASQVPVTLYLLWEDVGILLKTYVDSYRMHWGIHFCIDDHDAVHLALWEPDRAYPFGHLFNPQGQYPNRHPIFQSLGITEDQFTREVLESSDSVCFFIRAD